MSWQPRYCNTCGCTPCNLPTFCEACRAADKRVAARRKLTAVTLRRLDELPEAIRQCVAWSTKYGQLRGASNDEIKKFIARYVDVASDLSLEEAEKVSVRPDEVLHGESCGPWTEEERYLHLKKTFDLVAHCHVDLFEPYVVRLVEAPDRQEEMSIMIDGLRDTAKQRFARPVVT